MSFDPGAAAGAGQDTPPTTVAPPNPSAPVPGLDSSGLGTLIGEAIRAASTEQESTAPPFQAWLASLFGGSVTGTDPATAPPMTGLRTQGGPGSRSATTIHEVVAQVSRLSSAELSYLQRRLFQAGFYDGDVYANASVIDWGTIDDATVGALERAFTKATTNQVADFDAFLENERGRFLRTGVTEDGTSLDPGSAAETASVVNITLEDPDTIRQLAEASAIELLGRKPTEEELSRITAKIHAEQRATAQRRAQAEVANEADTLPDLSDEATLLRGEAAIPIDYDPAGSKLERLSAEQVDVARTIIQVGQEMGLSEEYIVGALSAGIVESGLRNVNYGDRDSLGVFQQRAHYGSAEQRLDVRRSAQMFYQEMLRVKPGANLGEWVADTQRPAKQYRGRYGEVMNDAAKIYTLLGNVSSRPMNPRQGDAGMRLTPQVGIRSSRPGGDNPKNMGQAFRPQQTVTSPVPIEHPDSENPFWLDRFAGVGNSAQDPIYNEIMGVDVGASIAEELKRIDPVGYATRQAAAKTYEFFALLGAGGGAI